ncbi:sulfotransferase family protein [Aestuariirhabdus litorea]|uniref:Sulfotransferase n=1 Tax=Aestuariirhabdus litorea TaxID=2528527 RepID=A0A3P3VPD6_9GAMM|nr:sulfotransferase [Aestuariirhabdus litorea]RRJ84575.1 sulfotransferase [Aestuariirhabdus litorea]RWW97801.1 sulfotransferase [Endozoicomonadaceae bacterium GTF-13]
MSATELREKVIKTVRHYQQQTLFGLRGVMNFALPVKASRPVFVVGCSRAGTTLVYKTLSQSLEIGTLNRETHDLWASLHDLQSRGWDSHRLSKQDALSGDEKFITGYFYSRTGMSRFVDKNNQNGLCVSYLNALYPDALFVYVKRNPGDNIHSLIEGWKRDDEYGTWSEQLPAEVSIDQGHYRRWCFFLFPGWRDYLNGSIERVCAEQYRSMNQAIIDDAQGLSAGRFMEVKYEQILEDPIASFDRLYRFCGLNFTAAVREHAETVLRRPYNAFSEIKKNKWVDSGNAARIKPVLGHTESVAQQMGYERSDYMDAPE